MTFGREKRLLLGSLAFLAPLPLPLNGIVGWTPILLYLAGVALFLRRAWIDPPAWLPIWAMNVLGVIYIPIFLLDLRSLSRGLVGPVVHLGLFALLVKLCALSRERDKWQAVVGIFFVFLAAIGTSTHPTIVLYLAAYLALSLLLFTRFAIYHVLTGFGRAEPALAAVPMRRFIAGTTALGVLVALPLFLVLPRVRAPFIAGRASGMGGSQEAVGFSEEVSLDAFGRIRGDRNVALRLQQEGPTPISGELRFKAATYDRYVGTSWLRSPPAPPLERQPGMRYQIAPGSPQRWATIWLQPLRSRSVPVPVETRVLEPASPSLQMDEGGAVSFPILPLEVRQYRVGLGDEPYSAAVPSKVEGALDIAYVSGRMSELAAEAMGSGTPLERARRLESHLMTRYSYTLDFVGRDTSNPIEDFLFRYRSGHCELFASSMVLLLRSQGIPARLVTGFLGGEFNPFEGYTMVRNENAHAWVEGYIPGLGWQIFDPTPAAGRPASGREGGLQFLQQAWDYLEFRWDRYVLSFNLYDQLRIVSGLRSLWHDFWAKFRRPERAPTPSTDPGLPVVKPAPAGESAPWWSALEPLYLIAAFLAMALAAFALWWFRFRQPLTATLAYRRLRRRLDRTGRALGVAAAPLAVGRETAKRFPEAARPSARVIDFYLRESFGGEELSEAERADLAAALAEAERSMRKAG